MSRNGAQPVAGNGHGSLRGRVIPTYSLDPRELTLVTESKHPLYDERVHWPLDEAMIASIMADGVLQPIVARRNGTQLEVIFGRQRTKNAVEANRRLKEKGAYLIKVPVVIRGGDDRDLLGASIAENEIRRPDIVLMKAAKARRMVNLGATNADIAVKFGVVAETIENWLKLDELHPDIKKLVARGKLKYTVAMRLSKLKRQDQIAKVREIMRAGATNANAVRAVVGGKLERVKPPTKQQLRRVADAFLREKEFLSNDQVSDTYAFVGWVLGRISTDELMDILTTKAAGPIVTAVRAAFPRKG